jgi:integrase
MAVTLNKLTDAGVKSAAPGDYGDGGGLYLQVTPTGSKSWVFRYKWRGKTTRLGLGALHAVSLKDARQKATGYRKLLADDINPRGTKSAVIPTFGEAFGEFVKAQGGSWSSTKHAKQWHMTIDTYCKALKHQPVDQIDVAHVQDALQSIWYAKPETARRVRQRIAKVLGFAAARKWRGRENPADWKNNLEHIFKANNEGEKKHHRALPYPEAPAFMRELASREAMSARMLELAILTGSRTNEVTGARWEDVDLEKGEWARVAGSMKARRSHTVYLGLKGLALLKKMHLLTGQGDFVFPGQRGRRMSNMAMLTLLDRMKRREDTTAHGFRSTLTDWANEETHYPRAVIEMTLAHAIENKTEAAYRRGELATKRRALLTDWEKFLETGKTSASTGNSEGVARDEFVRR